MPMITFAKPTKENKISGGMDTGGGPWGAPGYGLTGPAAAGSGSVDGNASKLTPNSATGGTTMPFGVAGGPAGQQQVRGGRGGGMMGGAPGTVGGGSQQTGNRFVPPGGPSTTLPQAGGGDPMGQKGYGASVPGKLPGQVQNVQAAGLGRGNGQFSRNPFLQQKRQGWAAQHAQPTGSGAFDPNAQYGTVPQNQGGQSQYDYYNNIIQSGGYLDPAEQSEWARLRNQFSQSTGNAGTGGGGAA